MQIRTLGRSGCAVSAFALGTMTFGRETDEAGSREQLDTYVESGGDLVTPPTRPGGGFKATRSAPGTGS